jgi:hypothetical protein
MTVGNIDQKTWLTPLLCVLVFAAGIVPHLQNVNDPFLADDWTHLIASQHFSLGQLATLSWPSKSEFLFRPLAAVYFWANYALFGLDASCQRIVKLATYALCGVALYYFLLIAARSQVFAAASALIFILHPLNKSAAVWLSTHANCLSVFFGILALIFFVKARQHVKGRTTLYGAFLLSMLLSFCSMEMVYGLPLIVAATDVLLLRPNEGRRRKLKELLRWHIPYVFVAGAFYAFRFHIGMPQYLARHSETRSLGEVLLNSITRIPALFVLPDGKSVVWPDNVVPLAIVLMLACLLVATFITKKRHAFHLTIFAVVWYVAAAIPVIRVLPWRSGTPIADMRHLLAMTAPAGMLAGTCILFLTDDAVKRAFLVLVLCFIVAALGIAEINVGKEWTTASQVSQSLVATAAKSCAGQVYPIRLVFLDYPPLAHAQTITSPVDAGLALVVTNTVKVEERYSLATAYTEFVPEKYDENERNEILRFFPVTLSGEQEANSELLSKHPELATIHTEDLPKTFFFYWDTAKGECVDCTSEMRERLARARESPAIEWHVGDPLGPGHMVRPILCQTSVVGGLLRLTTVPDNPYPAYIEVTLPDVNCDEYDELELKVSFAGKLTGDDSCSIKVAWLLDDEKEDASILSRNEELRMYFYQYHTMRTLHFNLAQWFMKEKGRHIKKLYIILPRNVKETVVKSISFKRLKAE